MHMAISKDWWSRWSNTAIICGTLAVNCLIALLNREAIQHRIQQQVDELPSVKWQMGHPPPRYNGTKVALLIEERTVKHMTPLLLHMLYVIPPEWQLLYLGSSESLSIVQRNPAIQHHQTDGKLELRLAPRNESYGGREQRNRLLTDAAFYKEYLPAAEWLFMYHTDSILCANSPLDLNDWLKYDWVGAPWYNYDRWSGGGGLSLRRVSRIKQVLSFQTRQDDADSEDKWLSDRIKVLPGIKLPKPEVEKSFAVEGTWHEKPMGFHLPSSTDHLLKEAWDDPEHRKKAFEYCPEVKMIMNMKLERERCEEKPKEETPPTKEQIEKEMKEHLEKEMKEQAEKKAAMIIEEEKKHAKSENGKGAEASSAPRGDATLVLYTTVIAAAV